MMLLESLFFKPVSMRKVSLCELLHICHPVSGT